MPRVKAETVEKSSSSARYRKIDSAMFDSAMFDSAHHLPNCLNLLLSYHVKRTRGSQSESRTEKCAGGNAFNFKSIIFSEIIIY